MAITVTQEIIADARRTPPLPEGVEVLPEDVQAVFEHPQFEEWKDALTAVQQLTRPGYRAPDVAENRAELSEAMARGEQLAQQIQDGTSAGPHVLTVAIRISRMQ